jgi:hypothetical protein
MARVFGFGKRGTPVDVKVIFAPIGIVAGLLAGLVAQKGFERLWAVFDDEEPPAPDHRELSYPKLLAALVVEGAIFRLTKGLVDRGVRSGFERMTGTWPGESAPEQTGRA